MRLLVAPRVALPLLAASAAVVSAFHPLSSQQQSTHHLSHHHGGRSALISLSAESSTPSSSGEGGGGGVSIPSSTANAAKKAVLTLARQLTPQQGGDSKSGVFLTDLEQQKSLRKAVAELEAISGTTGERERQLMVGEWTLLCTTNSPSGRPGGLKGADKAAKGKKKKKKGLPFNLPDSPLKDAQERIRDKVSKSFEVTQRIRTSEDDDSSSDIDRVDNVIEFAPPFETLADILSENSPLKALKDVKLNPLEVKKSKVALIHNAKVESTSPVLRTKISLKSVVLTVAGTSQYLDPDGADILGLNVPLGEFLNAGYFDTTFVDENLRISRGSVGRALDVLRVFVRKGMYLEDIESAEADAVDGAALPEKAEKSELQSGAEKLVDAVGDAVQGVVDTLNDDLEKVRDRVEAVGEAVEDAAEDLAVSVTDGVVEVQAAVEEVRDAVKGEVAEVAEDVKKEIEDAIEELEDQAEEGLAAAVGQEDAAKVREAVDDAKEDVLEGVKNVTEAVRDAAEDVVEAAEGGVEKVRDAAEEATEVMSEDVANVEKAVEVVAEDVAEAVRSEAEEENDSDEESDEDDSESSEEEQKKKDDDKDKK